MMKVVRCRTGHINGDNLVNDKATVLVIDDDEAIRSAIVDYLSLEGYAVVAAENGTVGVALAQQHLPDAIICDIMMPHMDGHAVLNAVRSHPHLSQIPFIFLTARTTHQDIRQGMNLGADDYVFKPFDAEDLLTALKMRLQKAADARAAVNPAYDDFVHVVSEELQIPLTGIRWATEAFEAYLDTMEPADVRSMTQSLRMSSQQMQRVLDQCALHTRMQTGQYNADVLEFSDLNALIMAAINEARTIARAAIPVNVTLDGDTTILCHESLKIALREIIANALAFSPDDGTVDIRGIFDASSRAWHIVVQDDGDGIAPQDIAQALLPFGQIDRRNHQQPGVGLGLTLAKTIIEHHDGDLQLGKAANGRMTVSITLPTPKNDLDA